MKTDISNQADIKLLVNTFYSKVKVNSVLGYIFNDVAKLDWEAHLPKMYAFWSNILFGDHLYSGNPMQTHIRLNEKTALTNTEFEEWISLFTDTVNELFIGEKADLAILRANSIAELMQYKIEKQQ